jgi:hypothetical protein
VPRCYTQNLAAGLHGFQAGLGNRGFILTLTNTVSTSCSLSGYPGLGLQNARHQTLPSHTFRGSTYFDPDPGRSLIVLSPGETVSADLSYAGGQDRARPRERGQPRPRPLRQHELITLALRQ